MEKQEFLAILRQCLESELPDYEVENNIHYYESYLVSDKDKTIEEKLKDLGEPRLIAKTIIDAYIANHENSSYKKDYYSQNYNDYDEVEKFLRKSYNLYDYHKTNTIWNDIDDVAYKEKDKEQQKQITKTIKRVMDINKLLFK